MKRYINKIFILFTAICLLTGLLTGCTTRKNVIPKKLGTQEGLWLYYKDKRSRTDGTQKQNILQTVEFAEKSYDKDSFKVKSQVYLTNIKTRAKKKRIKKKLKRKSCTVTAIRRKQERYYIPSPPRQTLICICRTATYS